MCCASNSDYFLTSAGAFEVTEAISAADGGDGVGETVISSNSSLLLHANSTSSLFVANTGF